MGETLGDFRAAWSSGFTPDVEGKGEKPASDTGGKAQPAKGGVPAAWNATHKANSFEMTVSVVALRATDSRSQDKSVQADIVTAARGVGKTPEWV
jgi:hypothetical protein